MFKRSFYELKARIGYRFAYLCCHADNKKRRSDAFKRCMSGRRLKPVRMLDRCYVVNILKRRNKH